jgi:hypothetical protein
MIETERQTCVQDDMTEAQAMPGDEPQVSREASERELLDVIGPEIERVQRRRQFRNFVVFIAAVFAVMLCAYWAWKSYLGSPTIQNLFLGPKTP